jgi:hypothetical protein
MTDTTADYLIRTTRSERNQTIRPWTPSRERSSRPYTDEELRQEQESLRSKPKPKVESLETRQANTNTVRQRMSNTKANPIPFQAIANSAGNIVNSVGSGLSSTINNATSFVSNQLKASQPQQTQQSKPNPATSGNADFVALNKSLSNTDLEYRKKIEDATLQANINRVKQYEPLANNEKNRALGMELATRLPYSSFEENLRSMRQAGINATNMTNSISGAYSNSVSRLNPVSMSL